MSRNYDSFDDVINGTGGVFDGGALADHDKAKTTPSPQGVEVTVACRKCGAPAELMCEYGELIAVAHDVSPQAAYGAQYGSVVREPVAWKFSEGNDAWYPDVPCARCRGFMAPMFSPTEARDHVVRAKARGWLDERSVGRLSQAAMAAKQAGRR